MHFLKGGASTVAEVVSRSLTLAMPEIYKDAIVDLCSWPGSTPSPALARYYELSLDVAIMLILRDRCDVKGCVRFDWSDASQQTGYDWLLSQYKEVPRSSIVECFEATLELQRAMDAHMDQARANAGDDEAVGCLRSLSTSGSLGCACWRKVSKS